METKILTCSKSHEEAIRIIIKLWYEKERDKEAHRAMIDKIFDFLYDPFGNKKRREDAELKEMIKLWNKQSKQLDEMRERNLKAEMDYLRELMQYIEPEKPKETF